MASIRITWINNAHHSTLHSLARVYCSLHACRWMTVCGLLFIVSSLTLDHFTLLIGGRWTVAESIVCALLFSFSEKLVNKLFAYLDCFSEWRGHRQLDNDANLVRRRNSLAQHRELPSSGVTGSVNNDATWTVRTGFSHPDKPVCDSHQPKSRAYPPAQSYTHVLWTLGHSKLWEEFAENYPFDQQT